MENKSTLNRMFINVKNNCFITLKDHKAYFLSNPKTRLVKDFYPTITKELLSKCLNFAETKVQITEDVEKIIYHLRK